MLPMTRQFLETIVPVGVARVNQPGPEARLLDPVRMTADGRPRLRRTEGPAAASPSMRGGLDLRSRVLQTAELGVWTGT